MLHQNELSQEEYIILCSKPETIILFPENERLHSLDAKFQYSAMKKNVTKFLDFCLESLFQMHHIVSFQEVLAFIESEATSSLLYKFKNLNFTYHEMLIEKFFIEGPHQIERFNYFPRFFYIQAQIVLTLFDDLWEQVFIEEECETYIFNYPNIQLFSFLLSFFKQTSQILKKDDEHNKKLISLIRSTGIYMIILEKLLTIKSQTTNQTDISRINLILKEMSSTASYFSILQNSFYFDIVRAIAETPYPMNEISILKEVFSQTKTSTLIHDNITDIGTLLARVESIQSLNLVPVFKLFIDGHKMTEYTRFLNQINREFATLVGYTFIIFFQPSFSIRNIQEKQDKIYEVFWEQYSDLIVDSIIPLIFETYQIIYELPQAFSDLLVIVLKSLSGQYNDQILHLTVERINFVLNNFQKESESDVILGNYLGFLIIYIFHPNQSSEQFSNLMGSINLTPDLTPDSLLRSINFLVSLNTLYSSEHHFPNFVSEAIVSLYSPICEDHSLMIIRDMPDNLFERFLMNYSPIFCQYLAYTPQVTEQIQNMFISLFQILISNPISFMEIIKDFYSKHIKVLSKYLETAYYDICSTFLFSLKRDLVKIGLEIFDRYAKLEDDQIILVNTVNKILEIEYSDHIFQFYTAGDVLPILFKYGKTEDTRIHELMLKLKASFRKLLLVKDEPKLQDETNSDINNNNTLKSTNHNKTYDEDNEHYRNSVFNEDLILAEWLDTYLHIFGFNFYDNIIDIMMYSLKHTENSDIPRIIAQEGRDFISEGTPELFDSIMGYFMKYLQISFQSNAHHKNDEDFLSQFCLFFTDLLSAQPDFCNRFVEDLIPKWIDMLRFNLLSNEALEKILSFLSTIHKKETIEFLLGYTLSIILSCAFPKSHSFMKNHNTKLSNNEKLLKISSNYHYVLIRENRDSFLSNFQKVVFHDHDKTPEFFKKYLTELDNPIYDPTKFINLIKESRIHTEHQINIQENVQPSENLKNGNNNPEKNKNNEEMNKEDY